MTSSGQGSPERLNLREEGSGEPLVLIHGIGSSWRCWQPVLPALAAQHRVIALDLPGFGDSPPLPPGVPRTVPALVDAVESEMDAIGLETPRVAGNSMGGWIALELARRGRAHDVVAISPAGQGTAAENRRSKAVLLALRAVARGLAGNADAACRSPVLRSLACSAAAARPWRMEADDAAHAVRALANSPGFRATLDWLFSNPIVNLREIECPVRILWGGRDLILSPRQGPRFATALPRAELRPLAGLGHIPMSDDPALVASLILAATCAEQSSTRPSIGALQ